MNGQVPEADWKVFRQLRPVALERFCRRVLDEVVDLAAKDGGSSHDRYLAVFKLVKRRDKALADAFDDPGRSTALFQLAHIRGHGLLTEEEFARFSEATRTRVDGLLELGKG